ncbi:MAG: S24/S26 family peptidase [Clostridia bacterium]|nr:S24/S26 family peptidase [Clostridia bacterium]
MTEYEIYVLILCLIVFVLLVALSAVCLTAITKMYTRLIRCGEEDEKLIKEYEKLNGGCSKAGDVIAMVFNVFICIIFVIALGFSIYINNQDESVSYTVPTYRVVKSDSMSEKYSGNTYLYDNGLDDQFETFDILLTYKMPDEFDLQLYDIVVYEFRGELVIHRIVGIEEPNEDHPDSRLFILQGDANAYSDSLKVEYSQMKGIYYGERIRFVGSFILFMQSPAGWLCVILIVATVILTPLLENYIGRQKYKRLCEIGKIKDAKVMAELNAAQQAAKKQDMRGGFYDVVQVPVKAKPKRKRYSGQGFYDIVELYPDGNYRTIKTEAEREAEKGDNKE